MTSAAEPQPRAGLHSSQAGAATRELIVTLLVAAAGAGLVFLATRQTWAHVRTIPPKPLPATDVTVTGAQLVPYADALVLAALGTLAAVLASRGLLRRFTGGALAALGAVLAASAFTVSAAGAISAANAGVSPASAGAGSVTSGSNTAPAAVPNVAGAAPHASLSAGGWQAVLLVGAVVMIGAGLVVVCRARRLAVMSSRYDSPLADSRHAAADEARATGRGRDSASIWEALSRGDDPTLLARGGDPPPGWLGGQPPR